MTPEEQLDEARAEEARRLWATVDFEVFLRSSPTAIAARLAREGWTPPEPVDPDVLAFREWAKRSILKHISGRDVDAGKFDDVLDAHAYLAGARMAREQERERAKVLEEYVEIDTRRLDGVGGRALAVLAKYRGEA